MCFYPHFTLLTKETKLVYYFVSLLDLIYNVW